MEEKKRKNKKQFILNTLFVLNLLFLIIFLDKNLFSYRYAKNLLEFSNHQIIILITIFLYEIMCGLNLLLSWTILLTKNNFKKSLLQKVFSVSTAVSINGLNSALAFIYPTFQNIFSLKQQKEKKTSCINKKLLFAFFCFLLLFFGFFIKTNSVNYKNFIKYFTVNYLSDRLSTHLYITNYFFHLHYDDTRKSEINIFKKSIFRSFENRFYFLINKKEKFEEDQSKSLGGLINYKVANSKLGMPVAGGCSPGLFGISLIIFPLFEAALAVFIVSISFKIVFLKIFTNKQSLNWIGAAAFAYGPLRLFTDDPVSILNPFESTPYIFILFGVIIYLWKK